MTIPTELRYTAEHEWVAVDGPVASVGIEWPMPWSQMNAKWPSARSVSRYFSLIGWKSITT